MDRRKHRLLLMDMVPDRRLGLSSLLSQAGYSVEAVADSLLALSLAKVRAPDLAILAMPQGLEVCAALRAEPALHALPIIVVASDAASEARERALSSGADEVVSMPVAKEVLLELVNQLLHIRDVARHLDLGVASLVAALSGSRH